VLTATVEPEPGAGHEVGDGSRDPDLPSWHQLGNPARDVHADPDRVVPLLLYLGGVQPLPAW
jgi:hypothetical protein